MSSMLRLRKGVPQDVEEGQGGDGALMSKISELQSKNNELEVTVSLLKANLDQLKSKTRKVPSMMDDIPGAGKHSSFLQGLYDRGSWLIGLLVVQSFSSIILSSYENLLNQHPAIVFFLTMLIGAGGNAGNQAAVRVIQGFATGELRSSNCWKYLLRECWVAISLTLLLGTAGFLRTFLSGHTDFTEKIVITLVLMLIVFLSILLGTLLPFMLDIIGMDPAHSSTSIQVLMDILGVLITCSAASLLLKSAVPHV